MSSQKLTTEAESESLAEPSIVTNETECGSISLSTSEFKTEPESESLGKSSVITNETECGSLASDTYILYSICFVKL
jgi:hypothetical protein